MVKPNCYLIGWCRLYIVIEKSRFSLIFQTFSDKAETTKRSNRSVINQPWFFINVFTEHLTSYRIHYSISVFSGSTFTGIIISRCKHVSLTITLTSPSLCLDYVQDQTDATCVWPVNLIFVTMSEISTKDLNVRHMRQNCNYIYIPHNINLQTVYFASWGIIDWYYLKI